MSDSPWFRRSTSPHTVTLVLRMRASPPHTPGLFSTQLAGAPSGEGGSDTVAWFTSLAFMTRRFSSLRPVVAHGRQIQFTGARVKAQQGSQNGSPAHAS